MYEENTHINENVCVEFNQIQLHQYFRQTCNALLTLLSFPLKIFVGQPNCFRELLSNLHLWFQHLELILNVLLHARVGGGGQSHHGNRAELLAQHIQPFVVLPKIMTPLVQKQNSGISE